MPGGRPRLSFTQKAARTSITLTPETHDRAINAGINISAVCEAALARKLNECILLPEIQKILTDEMNSLEKELESNLTEAQVARMAKIRSVINRMKGDAYVEKKKNMS